MSDTVSKNAALLSRLESGESVNSADGGRVIAEFHYLDDGSEGPPRRWETYRLVPLSAADILSTAPDDNSPWVICWDAPPSKVNPDV